MRKLPSLASVSAFSWKMTHSQATKLAIQIKSAISDSKAISSPTSAPFPQETTPSSAQVQGIHPQHRPRHQPRASKSAVPDHGPDFHCFNCGDKSHSARSSKCPARGKKCSACGKMNHFASMCWSSQNESLCQYASIFSTC